MALSSFRHFVLAAAVSATLGFSTRAADPVPAALPAASQPAASVVVTINGKPILSTEFDRELQGVQMQASRQFPPEALAQLMPQFRQQAMANLVNKNLLVQAVADRKIVVADDEVKKALDEVMKNVPPGKTLDEALTMVGITKAEFMKQMMDSMGIEKLLAEETKGHAVTDADLTKFYAENPEQFKRFDPVKGETVDARHILVMFGKDDTEAQKAEKKKKAEAIRDRLIKGEDFAKLAAETSEDPGSKDKGGLYPDIARGKMVPPFENAAFTQKVGEIGPIVETEYGYHIIKVEKHAEATIVPLAEVKDRLKTYLENKQKRETAQKYVKALHDGAKITYAEGFAPPPVERPATAPTTAPASTPTTAPAPAPTTAPAATPPSTPASAPAPAPTEPKK